MAYSIKKDVTIKIFGTFTSYGKPSICKVYNAQKRFLSNLIKGSHALKNYNFIEILSLQNSMALKAICVRSTNYRMSDQFQCRMKAG